MDLEALALRAQEIVREQLPNAVMTLTKITEPTLNEITQAPTGAATETSYSIFGVIPVPGQRFYYENGTLVLRTGQRIRIPAKELPPGVEPQAGWIITTGQQTFRVVGTPSRICPDGVTTIMWDLEVAA